MVEGVLVKEYLSETQIKVGESLLERLDASNTPVLAAFWILLYERGYWRFIVVTPLVEKLGASEAWDRILQLSQSGLPENQIDFLYGGLSVLGAKDPYYKRMLQSIRSSEPFHNDRLTSCVVAGDLADLYVYRFPATFIMPKTKRGLKHA